MIRFFRTFYGKLSLIFLLLLILLGVTQIYLTMQAAARYIDEVDQKLNLGLAQDMARELKPLIKNELDFDKIGHRIHYMMVINPKVEIYVLDQHGKILAFFAEPGKKVKSDHVDLGPIHEFLKYPGNLPIVGDDPRNPDHYRPFSVAHIALGDKGEGYLYIVIGGERYESVTAMLQSSYVVKTIVRGLSVSVLVAGIIGLILFALLTKRIRSMSETVEKFEKGELNERIQTMSGDEIGHLGQSFNRMADTIVANMDALKERDDLRRELIANVSHDLRSPLASIQGYLETIMIKDDNNTLDTNERTRYLDIILKNTEMLNKMVHELFELSKLEAKQVLPNYEPFAMAELVQDVTLTFADQAEKNGIKLETQLPAGLPRVYADIAMIERALSNLIKNAIAFTDENGSVRVEVVQNETIIRTRIIDSGSGIAPEDLPHIFDRFYIGQKKQDRSKSSTGLGLTIAKKILESHHSTITVSSRPGEGTIFTFDLPVFSNSGGLQRPKTNIYSS